ncbi:MAG: ribosomal RNA small subunit methyltransferase A [Sedimentisphaerales bacterium]|nr:ribosomal RNA small subunit methyltransferase A [Sedimentisphaerales bacterium]
MQTKSQIRQLLESSGIKPNKRLGQHFLIDLNLMRLLADSADIQKNDVVLEAGCGTGSFTAILAQKAGRIIAVELDKNLFNIAKEQLSEFKNVELLNIDVLENKNTLSRQMTNLLTLAHEYFTGRILLIANLPYNVASPVMMNLITGPTKADGMFVTVQKEVADRMKAKPGSSDYGVLSIIMQAAGDVEIIRLLKPSVFWPKPQVDSAMIKYVRRQIKFDRISDKVFFAGIVHLFMNHRRKTMHACSRLDEAKIKDKINWADIFEQCNINPQLRPDQITPEQYIAISSCIKQTK